jgi:hypothetical protein
MLSSGDTKKLVSQVPLSPDPYFYLFHQPLHYCVNVVEFTLFPPPPYYFTFLARKISLTFRWVKTLLSSLCVWSVPVKSVFNTQIKEKTLWPENGSTCLSFELSSFDRLGLISMKHFLRFLSLNKKNLFTVELSNQMARTEKGQIGCKIAN